MNYEKLDVANNLRDRMSYLQDLLKSLEDGEFKFCTKNSSGQNTSIWLEFEDIEILTKTLITKTKSQIKILEKQFAKL